MVEMSCPFGERGKSEESRSGDGTTNRDAVAQSEKTEPRGGTANMRVCISSLLLTALIAVAEPGFRPPSVPLLARGPYFSVWSAADNLTDTSTSWGLNGDDTEMVAAAFVDGIAYRLMGQATASTGWTVHLGTDVPGADLPGMPVHMTNNTWEACQTLCNQTAACQVWAFGPGGCSGDPSYGQCWLKSAETIPLPNSCRDYGTKPDHRGFPSNFTAQQLDVDVFPTRTLYQFRAGGVFVNFTFTTAYVPGEAMEAAWARDVSTLDVSVASADGAAHSVSVYFDVTGDLVTNQTDVALSYGMYAKSAGVAQSAWMQPTFPQTLSDMQSKDRGSYGKLLLAAAGGWATGIDVALHSRSAFASSGALPSGQAAHGSGTSTPGSDNPVLAAGAAASVPASGAVSVGGGPVAVGMSFDPAFLFFGRNLRPYWTQLYPTEQAMVEASVTEHAAVIAACEAFDANVTGQLQTAGGDDYRLVGSLAYRQSWASTTQVWSAENASKWVMLKEISSGSDSQTSDVIYPAFPLYAWSDPDAAWRLLIPLMEYSINATNVQYNLAWAPHHLGKYPVGDITPSEQEQMPIEETAFMLISLAYLEAKLGDGKGPWLPQRYWAVVDTWGNYLKSSTEIPRNQLTTDDFLGPMPNCTNLAAKGIIGMTAYARLVRARGDNATATAFDQLAVQYAEFWNGHSLAASKDHYQLEYDLANSWSTKYNFMLQQALASLDDPPAGLSNFPFPGKTIQTELDFYLQQQFNKYGTPLFSKATFGKADWFAFAGALMDQSGFNKVMSALRGFLNDTPQRVPFTDWYDTITADQKGFRCRAVVGGMFARLYLGATARGHA